MAVSCSLPLCSTLTSWNLGGYRSTSRYDRILIALLPGIGNSNSSIRHRKHRNLLPPDGRRAMNAANESPQPKQSPGLDSATSSKMAIQSHGEPSPILKRSYSTPTVRSMAQEPAAATTAAEKKRNKLGYHRTSIACTHCRRRKIRCIVSQEIQNQCVNCIRLKKDCSFYPVDQQPIAGSRAKPADQGTGSSVAHSQSSSPDIAPKQLDDTTEESGYEPGSLTDPIVHPAPAIVPSSVGYASVNSEGLSMPISAEQNFSVSPGSSLAWGSAEPSPAILPGSMDMGYAWQPYGAESIPAEQISPFDHGTSSGGPAWVTGREGAMQPSNWNWDSNMPPPAPARSVSFSGGFVGQQQHQFSPVPSNAPFNEGGSGLVNMFPPPLHHSSGPGAAAGQVVLGGQPGWQHPHQQPSQQQLQQDYQNQQYHQQNQQHQQHQQQQRQNMEFSSWDAPQHGPPPM